MHLKHGRNGSREAVRWFTKQIIEIESALAEVQYKLFLKWREIPYAENILEIIGIGENILSGILAEMGDIRRFDEAKEIQMLSDMSWCPSAPVSIKRRQGSVTEAGKGSGTGSSRRQISRNACRGVTETPCLLYDQNGEPLKKIQSLAVSAFKILRVIFRILKNGTKYDPEKCWKISGIRHQRQNRQHNQGQ